MRLTHERGRPTGDMDGVPNAPLYMMFPEAVGANPAPIAFAEVYLHCSKAPWMRRKNPLPTIEAKKCYEIQSNINLTGHITDALLTIVGGPAWDGIAEADRTALRDVTWETAVCATDAIIKAESELAEWFRGEGVQVNDVDRAPFIEAVKKLHNGEAATWDQAVYDRLQAIE